MDEIITLAYGSGGVKTSELIDEMLLPAFKNEELNKLSDGAVIKIEDELVFSTDSFVVTPHFFKGGNIGKLAVCGTVNDICMCGGEPKYLSLGLIIEEGFKTSDLNIIISSIKETAERCNVKIVTGDTKVVEKGKCDGIYINTSGIGILRHKNLGKHRIQEDDVVIVSGTLGDHSISIMAERNNMMEDADISSDCAPLVDLSKALMSFGDEVRILRDPTRGGIATTLNEFIEGSNLSIELDEELIPVKATVSNMCEILGLDPLYAANEGKIVTIVSKNAAEKILKEMKKIPEGKDAAIIGKVKADNAGRVVMKTEIGGTRIITKLTGAQLPRIC